MKTETEKQAMIMAVVAQLGVTSATLNGETWTLVHPSGNIEMPDQFVSGLRSLMDVGRIHEYVSQRIAD